MLAGRKRIQGMAALLVLFLCLGVFLLVLNFRIGRTVVSPFFDGLNYAEKGMHFWQAMERGAWINPLDIEPVKRPPGTILMAYPTGFSEDPRGFFSRSVAIPLVLFVTALWISGTTAVRDRWSGAVLACLCLAFATLPLFYHFEPRQEITSPVFFGLVDGYLAAVSALALALIMKGVRRERVAFILAGAFLSGFTLMIKPSGILVMAVIAVVTGILAYDRFGFRPFIGGKPSSTRSLLFAGLAGFVVFYAFFITVSLKSGYLSISQLSAGRQAVAILKTEWSHLFSWTLLGELLHNSFGWHWMAVFAVVIVFSLRRRAGEGCDPVSDRDGDGRWSDMAAAAAILIPGLWFWLLATGITQIRYFYPFSLMVVTLLFPRVVRELSCRDSWFSRILPVTLTLPFFILTALLLCPEPPVSLMKGMGVSVTCGVFGREVSQAQELNETAGKRNKNLSVYAMNTDYTEGVFGGVGSYQGILRPGEPSFYVSYPMDWKRLPTFRFPEILKSDYLLFRPLKDDHVIDERLKRTSVPDFESERDLFSAWLSRAGSPEGIHVVSESSLRLVAIDDPGLFADALRRFLPRYEWRPLFREANGFDTGGYSPADGPSGSEDFLQSVCFDSRYLLQSASLDESPDGTSLRLVWKGLDGEFPGYVAYVHLLDRKGGILNNVSLAREQPLLLSEGRGEGWIDHLNVSRGPLPEQVDAVALCLGGTDGTLLKCNGCMTDWGGRRLYLWMRPDRSLTPPLSWVKVVAGGEIQRILQGKTLAGNVSFGDRFFLVGAAVTAESDGLRLDLVWRSLKCQALSYNVFVHLLNGEGKMTSNADYPQSRECCVGPEGMSWHDSVRLKREKLENVVALGIGLYHPPGEFLLAEGGRTDWGGRRLYLALIPPDQERR